jgi:hypothetical protein
MDNNTFFEEVKEQVATYVKLRMEWLKLSLYERIAKILTILSHSLIVMFVVFFSVLFLFFSLAFLFSEITGSLWLGFFIVFLLCVLILLTIVGFRKKIRNCVMNTVIKSLREDDEEHSKDLKTNE